MSESLSHGLELVRRAVDEDQAGNYAAAVRDYDAAIVALSQAHNEPANKANQVLISLKIREYSDRRVSNEREA